MFSQFLPITSNSEHQKIVRKTVSHLLFKDRLSVMLSVYKDHLNAEFDKWLVEIEKSGEVRIDLRKEVERIYAHHINHLVFGVDFGDEKFDFHYYDILTNSFTTRKCSLRESLRNMTMQSQRAYVERLKHPITGPILRIFGKKLEMGDFFQNLRANSQILHNKVNEYV